MLPTPFYHDEAVALYKGDALALLPHIPIASVQLIICDPPYFKQKLDYLGKRVEWDRQWKTSQAYLAWLRQLAKEWQRILTPNGSLYCFASPQMAAHVEVMLGELFTVLNRIQWLKDDGWHKKVRKEELRTFVSPREEILFCEQQQADAMALGESGYASQCEALHDHIFEPIQAYLESERQRASLKIRFIAEAFQKHSGTRTVTGGAGHWFSTKQWRLPSRSHYEWLQTLLNTHGQKSNDMYLEKTYEALRTEYEALRTEYEALRTEYEALRRPFQLSAKAQYTDVWDFDTVKVGNGKHPCEKPIALFRHIIETSSRPGDHILDCCAGSSVTLDAARQCGRKAIGIELEDVSCRMSYERLRQPSLW